MSNDVWLEMGVSSEGISASVYLDNDTPSPDLLDENWWTWAELANMSDEIELASDSEKAGELAPPGPEDGGGEILCIQCEEIHDVAEAEVTLDQTTTADRPGEPVMHVTRYYICSKDCSEAFMMDHVFEGIDADEVTDDAD